MWNRESLDTNDRLADHDRPTKLRTEQNTHELHCRSCGDTWFVDDATADRVRIALEYDPTENPFACERCEEEYAEDEHR